MNYNTIIFDLDGTLLDTLDDLHDSLNDILILYGYEPRSIDEVRQFIGNGVRTLIRRAVPESCADEKVEVVLQQFKIHYKNNMQNKTKPFDGIMELLRTLNKMNYSIAIVSNKYDLAVKELAKTYFGDLISLAIGETNQLDRKPAPDCVFEVIKKTGTNIDRTILIGDSETDILTAKNAGIPCVGVTWGYRSRKTLEEEGADYIIDTPMELMKFI